MSVSDKIRAVLNLTGHKLPDLAEPLGISAQAVRNKFSRDSFSADDLIKISDALDCEILFRTRDGQQIFLVFSDAKKYHNGGQL